MDSQGLAIETTEPALNSSSSTVANNVHKSSASPENNDRFAFERVQFGREDFTVQRFIYLAGKRANLEQIHADLRAYLRELQNSMVGLINDDYADFVNLSSKLAALKDSIDKVSSDINSAWSIFGNSTTLIRKTSETLSKKSTELKTSRTRQISIRNKISLLNSLEGLADCLSNRPSDLSKKWYIRFIHALTAVEFWHSRIPELEVSPNVAIAKDTCFAKARMMAANDLIDDLRGECRFVGLIITSLHIIGQLDHGVSVAIDLIKKSIESEEVQQLKIFYEQLFNLRKRWFDNSQLNGQYTKEVAQFLDDALLKFVLDYLDRNMGEYCIPTEATLFFDSYNSTVRFAQNFPRIRHHPDFLTGLNNRFNVHLYVKRVSTLLNEEVLAKVANTRIVWREDAKNDEHPLEASNAVLKSIEQMFSASVFLPIVADRFWEVTIQLINKHNEWLDYCLSAESTKVVDEMSGTITVLDRWPDLIALLAGSKQFDSKLFDFCLKSAFKQLEKVGGDPALFRQFFGEYNNKMEVKRGDIRAKILEQLLAMTSKGLQTGAGEIPKRYRWTKKPSPTESSPYIAETMEVQTKFGETATRRSWDPEMIMGFSQALLNGMVDCFLTNAQQVLSSVQLTGSSLQRFKRKGMAATENLSSNGTFGETDEAKICKQLYLDTKQMRVYAENANAKLDALDAFLKQLEQQESA